MRRTIILLSGKKRVGKDTVADHLVTHYGYKKFGFADRLKYYLKDIFGIDIDNHVGRDLTKKERSALQIFGTDCCRMIDNNVWVKQMTQVLWQNYCSDVDCMVIKDTRFPNEVQGIQKWGKKYKYNVITIRLEYLDGAPADSHSSEVGLDDWEFDYTLYRRSDTSVDSTLCEIDRIIGENV